MLNRVRWFVRGCCAIGVALSGGFGIRLAHADVDGDGLDEIVSGHSSGGLEGPAFFQIHDDRLHEYASLFSAELGDASFYASPSQVLVGDVDGDSVDDIVCSIGCRGTGLPGDCDRRDDARLIVALSRSGSFETIRATGEDLPLGAWANGLALCELDGLPGPEIVLATTGGAAGIPLLQVYTYDSNATALVLRGEGAGSPTADAQALAVTCGDFDGRGVDQVIVSLSDRNASTERFLQYYVWSEPSLIRVPGVDLAFRTQNVDCAARNLAVGNFDTDARPELAIGCGFEVHTVDDQSSGFLRLATASGWRVSVQTTSGTLVGVTQTISALATGDSNGDRIDELLAGGVARVAPEAGGPASSQPAYVVVVGSSLEPLADFVELAAGDEISTAAFGNLDSDVRQEFVVGASDSGFAGHVSRMIVHDDALATAPGQGRFPRIGDLNGEPSVTSIALKSHCFAHPEMFDGVDNDCNGVVDDCDAPQESWDCVAHISQPNCPPDVPGRAVCDAAGAGSCVAVGNGSPEVLNNLDDDCNGLIDDIPWTPIGPAPIDTAQTYGTPGFTPGASGRARVIAVNPTNHSEVWLGTAGGGLWHTENILTADPQWTTELDGSIGAIELQNCIPGPCEVWVGTGENAIRRDTYFGRGVYHGVPNGSGGRTYLPVGNSNALFTHGSIYRVLAETDRAYAAVSLGTSTTKHAATVWAPEPIGGYGIHRYLNGTWTRVFGPETSIDSGSLSGLPTDLERDPLDTRRYYAGVMGYGLFRSSAGDDARWCALNPGASGLSSSGCPAAPVNGLPAAGTFDHVELAVAPNSPIMVASFSNCPAGTTDGAQGVTATPCIPIIYRTNDGGASWTRLTFVEDDHGETPREVNPFGRLATYSRYTHPLRLLDDGTFYFGGLLLWRLHASDPVDTLPVQVGTDSLHPDHHDVLVFPGEGENGADLIYSANDGGISVSVDGGNTFQSANRNLVTTQFYGIGADELNENPNDIEPTNPGICGGLQDNGIAMFRGSRIWARFDGGDGGECRLPGPATAAWYTNQDEIKIHPLQSIFASSMDAFDGRMSIRAFQPVMTEHVPTANIVFADNRVFLVPPGQGLNSTAIQISPILQPDEVAPRPAIERSRNIITALGVAPADINRIYVGYYDGTIFRSTPGAPVASGGCASASSNCWQELAAPKLAPIAAIAMHPNDPDTLWVAYNSFRGPNVWTTTDGGTTWMPRANNIPNDMPVSFVRADPRDLSGSVLYAGTATGLMQSSDSGRNWIPFGVGSLPRVPVFDVAIDAARDRIYAATHGRGVYMLAGAPALFTFAACEGDVQRDVQVYGTAFSCPAGQDCNCSLEVRDADGDPCGSASDTDATGARIFVQNGFLATENGESWQNHGVVWACQDGACVGGTSTTDCVPASVRVSCTSNAPVVERVTSACVLPLVPPGTSITVSPAPSLASGSQLRSAVARSGTGFAVPGVLSLVPIVIGSPSLGGDRALCSARVAIESGDGILEVRDKIIAALNTEPDCRRYGITAEGASSERLTEDDSFDARVQVVATGADGAALALGYRLSAADGLGVCVSTSDTNLYLADRFGIRRLGLDVGATGAAGGSISIVESSPLGVCQHTVTTSAGQSASDIAAEFEDLFRAPGVPGPRTCLADENPRDLVRDGNGVVTRQAIQFTACVNDAGVGLAYGPTTVEIAALDAKLRDLAVLGLDGVSLRDGASVTDAGASARLGAGGSLGVTLFPDALTGDVLSVGTVELRDRAHLTGSVTTGQSIVRGNQTLVDGSVMEHALVHLPRLNGFITTVPSGGANHDVQSGTLPLTPGNYGSLSVKSGAVLTLATGTYRAAALVMEPGSHLLLDEAQGPVLLYVGSTLIWRGSLETRSGAHPSGFIAYQGSSDVFIESPFHGTLAAPNAKLVLRAVTGGHTGAFFGRFVEVDAHATVEFEPFTTTLACSDGFLNDGESDVDCGASCGAGCQLGQRCAQNQDCASGLCGNGLCQPAVSCTESNAVDLGAPGNAVTVPIDGCLRVRDGYPSWWGRRNLQLQTADSGTFPVPYTWSNSCTGAAGSGLFTAPWQSQVVGPTDLQCATLVDLTGSGPGTVTIRYFAN